MLPQDQENIANLNYIYNCNGVEAIKMLRMKRAPYSPMLPQDQENVKGERTASR
jgi:hypothetical protein